MLRLNSGNGGDKTRRYLGCQILRIMMTNDLTAQRNIPVIVVP